MSRASAVLPPGVPVTLTPAGNISFEIQGGPEVPFRLAVPAQAEENVPGPHPWSLVPRPGPRQLSQAGQAGLQHPRETLR